MKQLLSTFIACSLAVAGLHAEDVLLIRPQQVTPGATASPQHSFSIEMNNEHTFVAMQFDLFLPEGVTIEKKNVKLTDRLPKNYNEDDDVYMYTHNITCVRQAQGQYRITCSSTDVNNKISGNSGVLFNVRCTAAADMPSGILPIRITNVVLAINGNSDVKPADCVSFLYTPDVNFADIKSIDLTTVEGVVTQDVAQSARKLMTNSNALLYVNDGSAADGLDNVVVGNTCASLTLTDGYAFNAPKAFTATEATYTRTIAKEGWYSLCLPFAATPSEGVAVERFLGVEDNYVNVQPGNIEADKPAIFRATAGQASFTASHAEVAATPDILADDIFVGYYDSTEPGSLTGYYALRSDGSGFGVANATAYATPFRALIQPINQGQMLRIRHKSDTDGINAAGTQEQADIYTLGGTKASGSTLQRGVYVSTNKKIVIK